MSYSGAKPFPHAVIDGFLPASMARRAAGAFPERSSKLWKEFSGGGRAKKLELSDYEAMPYAIQEAVDYVHGLALAQVKDLTGFDDLMTDPSLYGGGLNLVEPGGYLAPHADFNVRDGLGYRTVNLLIYLNPDWSHGDGGELDLWANGRVARRIAPLFNRAVAFTTTDNAIHGYGTVRRTRRSMNFYFFRETAAPGISTEPHKTLWADQLMEQA